MTKKRHLATSLLVLGALALLIIQLLVQINLAHSDSETTDEGSHLNAGYTYVTTGDFRYNAEHPPLTKELAGLAILHLHPKTTVETSKLWKKSANFFYDPWHENLSSSNILLYQAGNNPSQLLFWGRVPFVVITFILGLAVFLIAFREWGAAAAFIATALFALDPTINAHGHLIDTDLPVALGYLLTIYASWQFFRRPSWWRSVWLGAALGLALLIKYTAVIAFPALLILFLFSWWRSGQKKYWLVVLPKLLVASAILIITIWAGYGFHDRQAPSSKAFSVEMNYADTHNGSTASFVAPTNPSLKDKIYSVIHPALDLLPGDFVKGVDLVMIHGSSGQKEFIFGQMTTIGKWYYFPLIVLVKTPLPTLLLGIGAIYWLFRRRSDNWLLSYLLIGGLSFFIIAMFSKADLGIRYILPVFPLAILAIAGSLSSLLKTGNLAVIVISLLLVWLAGICLLTYPSYLSYFNNLVGGSNRGYLLRSDSDVDWGQDLTRIANYLNDHKTGRIYLDYSWDGDSALNYYLGSGHWLPLSDWRPGKPGEAIFSGSSYELDSEDNFLKNPKICSNLKHITPGVLDCDLP